MPHFTKDLILTTKENPLFKPFTSHHHGTHCVHQPEDIQQRLNDATLYCKENGLRMTELRLDVLQLILEAQRPMGAYDILMLMSSKSEHLKIVAPPTVYRTLDFLLENHFIHRLSTLNAFIPCCHPRADHHAVFLICDTCKQVEESSDTLLISQLDTVTNKNGFMAKTSNIELTGQCKACRAKETSQP